MNRMPFWVAMTWQSQSSNWAAATNAEARMAGPAPQAIK
jgi:hypothetical protein